MRKLQKPPVKEAKTSGKEPLAEGLHITIPTDSCGRRAWSRMSDSVIVEYAKKVIEENGIIGLNELGQTDSGLHRILRIRGLFCAVGFENRSRKRRSWKDMRDWQIVEYAKKAMKENRITSSGKLGRTDPGLHTILSQRGLLDKVGFEDKYRNWKDMDDEGLIDFTRKTMESADITVRSKLQKADPSLYRVLVKRNLLDKVDFVEKRRSWGDMSDEEVVEFTQRVLADIGLRGRRDLEEHDSGLYRILSTRGLLEEVGFEDKQRSWKNLSNEGIVEIAREVMKSHKITSRSQLQEVDSGLCKILRARGLMDEVGFVEELRCWKDLSNDELVEFAKKWMKENGIIRRVDMEDNDSGLYHALRTRGLLDRAFAHVDQQKTDQARDAVIDALEAFAANDNGIAEDDVA
ncbi:MAG: hypothetical protein ABH983_04255 [Candidatus Micrarchaeota archaeon]